MLQPLTNEHALLQESKLLNDTSFSKADQVSGTITTKPLTPK